MDGSPKGHVVTNLSVATGECLHSRNDSIAILEMFSFVKVGQHSTDINGPMAELSQLPVNHEKMVGRLPRMMHILPFDIRKQHTETLNIIISARSRFLYDRLDLLARPKVPVYKSPAAVVTLWWLIQLKLRGHCILYAFQFLHVTFHKFWILLNYRYKAVIGDLALQLSRLCVPPDGCSEFSLSRL